MKNNANIEIFVLGLQVLPGPDSPQGVHIRQSLVAVRSVWD